MAKQAIFSQEAVITLVDNDKAVNDASADVITAFVSNYSESGGEEDTDSKPVFGGGNIDIVKPRTQMEVSFDVEFYYADTTGDSIKFDELKWGAADVNGIVKSSGDAPLKALYINWTKGSVEYTRAYNNIKAVTFEPEQTAEDELKGTITFKLSPTTADGVENFRSGEVAADDANISWA